MKKKKKTTTKKIGHKIGLVIISIIIIIFLITIFFENTSSQSFNIPMFELSSEDGVIVKTIDDGIKVSHVETPESVKMIYMTSWVAGTPSIRQRLIDLVRETEINSVMIDIKDDTGKISFIGNDPVLEEMGSYENRIGDIRELIEIFHDMDVYVMGRVAVFQDPHLTSIWPEEAVKFASTGGVWTDRKGLSWVDTGSQRVWDYVTRIAIDAHNQGFDEINFDYVRFPTDGAMSDMAFPYSEGKDKTLVVEEFFTYLHEKMVEAEITHSADVFGMVAVAKDGIGIGQVLEKITPHVDYIAPMVYPSHFAHNFKGLGDPNEDPYGVIYHSMKDAHDRLLVAQSLETTEEGKAKFDTDKLRPWLQDFDYGGEYDAADVRAQIQATYDVGLDSWMLWDPSNKYTRGALLE